VLPNVFDIFIFLISSMSSFLKLSY